MDTSTQQQLLALINDLRQQHGLELVTLDTQLNEAAQDHSDDMAYNDFFGHVGSDGSTSWDRLAEAGYTYQIAVENIAAGQITPAEVFQDWTTSSEHLANLLNPDVSNLGVGHVFLADDTGSTNYYDYWTLVLGTRIPGTEPVVVTPVPPPPPLLPTPMPVVPVPVPAPAPPQSEPEPVSPTDTPQDEPVSSPAPAPAPVPDSSQDESTNPENVEPESPLPESPLPESLLSEPTESIELESLQEQEPSQPESLMDKYTDNNLSTSGDDTIHADLEAESTAGGLGNDQIFGSAGDDVLRGDHNHREAGGRIGGDDTIVGSAGSDRIGGKGGHDTLLGGDGDDLLWGDDGDDLLRGGLGADTLTGDDFSGGHGADTFVLAAGEGMDTIVDFEVGIDLIGLADGLTFADLSLGQRGDTALIAVGEEALALVNNVMVNELTSEMFVVL